MMIDSSTFSMHHVTMCMESWFCLEMNSVSFSFIIFTFSLPSCVQDLKSFASQNILQVKSIIGSHEKLHDCMKEKIVELEKYKVELEKYKVAL